jgi:hypothetical protein
MADLTLHEYRDLPEDELKDIFRLEVRKMFGTYKKIHDPKGPKAKSQSNHNSTYSSPRYWTDVLAFVPQPIHKIQK